MLNQPDHDTGLVDQVVDQLRRERPDLDSLAIETVCRLIYVGRKMEIRAARVLKPYSLNYTDLDVLATLRSAGEPFELTPADLIRSAMITSGAMTTCLDRLEKRRMVRRRVSPNDHRKRCVSLTPSGRKLIDEAMTVRYSDASDLVSSLKVVDARKLNRLLRTIIDADHEIDPAR